MRNSVKREKVDQNNEEDYKRDLPTVSPLWRGIRFTRQYFCLCENQQTEADKLPRSWERYIDLTGVEQSYNVVLHPAGEKVLILDYRKKFYVYKVV